MENRVLEHEEKAEESKTVMKWNETCSDCYHFNPGKSTCDKTDVVVSPTRAKCREFEFA